MKCKICWKRIWPLFSNVFEWSIPKGYHETCYMVAMLRPEHILEPYIRVVGGDTKMLTPYKGAMALEMLISNHPELVSEFGLIDKFPKSMREGLKDAIDEAKQ